MTIKLEKNMWYGFFPKYIESLSEGKKMTKNGR